MVVSCFVASGNGALVPRAAARTLHRWAISPDTSYHHASINILVTLHPSSAPHNQCELCEKSVGWSAGMSVCWCLVSAELAAPVLGFRVRAEWSPDCGERLRKMGQDVIRKLCHDCSQRPKAQWGSTEVQRSNQGLWVESIQIDTSDPDSTEGIPVTVHIRNRPAFFLVHVGLEWWMKIHDTFLGAGVAEWLKWGL